MAYSGYGWDYNPGLREELSMPQSLLSDNYSITPFDVSRRALQPRSMVPNLRGGPMCYGGDDPAMIDREGPYGHPLARRSIGSPFYDDRDPHNLSDLGRQMPYSFPLSGMESGAVRWPRDQIQAYNRWVFQQNGMLARRRPAGPSDRLLYPMMDPHGRFPPGFDRPIPFQDWIGFEEPSIDSHRHHFGLPVPDTLERLLMVNSAERQLKHHLKQLQLLEFYGAKRLAEQLGLQLLAAQNVLPGLNLPRGVGYDLGSEFDDNYLTPSIRGSPDSMLPLDTIGYGNGIANWNYPWLSSQLRNPRLTGGSAGGNPWPRPGLFPGAGMSRPLGHSSNLPALPYGGGGGAFGDHGPYGMSMGGPSNGIGRDLERVSYDGGRGRRSGRFN